MDNIINTTLIEESGIRDEKRTWRRINKDFVLNKYGMLHNAYVPIQPGIHF